VSGETRLFQGDDIEIRGKKENASGKRIHSRTGNAVGRKKGGIGGESASQEREVREGIVPRGSYQGPGGRFN